MRILIFGGTGEVGAYVVRRLVASHHECTVFARGQRWDFLADVRGSVELIEGDVRDASAVDAAVAGSRCDAVCHLAAHLGHELLGPAETFAVNTMSTANILEAARRQHVRRVVYASSSVVYGSTDLEHGYPSYRPYAEWECPDPTSSYAPLYGSAKLAGEHLCVSYNYEFGMECMALRLAPVFCVGRASGHAALNAQRMIVDAGIQSESFSIGGGDELMDVVDGEDVALAFETACSASFRPDAAIINVASGRGWSLIDWAEATTSVFPGAEIRVDRGLDFMGVPGNYRVLDITRAGDVLDFTPTQDLPVFVTRYVATQKLLKDQRANRSEVANGF